MESKGIRVGGADIALLALGAAFFAGILFVFGPCGPAEDGGWMTCHWAGRAVTGVAAAICVMELVRLFMPRASIKQGIDIAVIPAAVLAMVIPGRLINLCMMHDMRCRAVMTPAVTVFSIVILAASVLDIFIQRKRDKA